MSALDTILKRYDDTKQYFYETEDKLERDLYAATSITLADCIMLLLIDETKKNEGDNNE